jgi:hypothetical protein
LDAGITVKKLKAKVALAALKGHQTANEIASEFRVHVSLVTVGKSKPLSFFRQYLEIHRPKKKKRLKNNKTICTNKSANCRLN